MTAWFLGLSYKGRREDLHVVGRKCAGGLARGDVNDIPFKVTLHSSGWDFPLVQGWAASEDECRRVWWGAGEGREASRLAVRYSIFLSVWNS